MILNWINLEIFLAILVSGYSGCRLSEFACSRGRCIAITRYCDGNKDCEDGSDEPEFCTPCNRTYYGDVGKTYEVEIHRPKDDKIPFDCHLTFSAEKEDFGDIIQLTFASFTIGTFSSFVKDGCPDGFLEIQEFDRPRVGGKWCGTSWSPTLFYSETNRITIILHLKKLLNDQYGYNFDVRIYYKMLKKNSAVVRFGFVSPNHISYSMNSNMSESNPPSSPTDSAPYFLGDLISGTYCSRIYSDCNEKVCRLQSPNFPGVYPRNLTCYYAVRQHKIPSGKHAVIGVRQSNGQLIAIRSSASLYGKSQQQQQTEQQYKEIKVWSDCDEVQDYVTVYDGYTTRDSPLLKFCGGREPVPEIISSGPELLVEFTTSPYGTFLFPGTPQNFHGFELEVKVYFLDQETIAYTRNKKCEFHLKGSGRGVLESPRHSLAPNTTCTYHLEGSGTMRSEPGLKFNFDKYVSPADSKFWHKQASLPVPQFKVWLSVLKFKVGPLSSSGEGTCETRLEVWDGNLRDLFCYDGLCAKEKSRFGGAKKSNATLLAKYCRNQSAKTCDHELLGNGTRRPRPCSPKESFLSSGNSMTLQLKMQDATALRHVSFKAFYEFVNLHQDGESFGSGPCSRKFISGSYGIQPNSVQKFQSPKDIFLFGRGGNTNLSCIYRFEGKKDERVRIIIQNLNTGKRPCKSLYHRDINRVLCHGNLSAFVHIFEYPFANSSPFPKDCICSGGDGITPLNFISSGHTVEVRFEVINMGATDDFKDFGFEGSWEFIRQAPCTRFQRLRGPSGEIHFVSPSRTPEEANCEYRPWIMEPSKGKYLYVVARGIASDRSTITYEDALSSMSITDLNLKCLTKNRFIIYTGGMMKCIVCPEPPASYEGSIVEIFSNGWQNGSDAYPELSSTSFRGIKYERAEVAESVIVEYLGKTDGQYSLTWLELEKRKSFLPPEGYVTKDCPHECPELNACINSSLWCDGTKHCPTGYDESLSRCYLIFQLPTLYLAFAFIGLISLIAIIAVGTVRSCFGRMFRRKSHAKALPSKSSLFKDREIIC